MSTRLFFFLESCDDSYYFQGVIASGLAALFVATGDSSLLDQAEITLDATVAHLTAGTSILKESCDDALAGGSVCDADQVSLCTPFRFYQSLINTGVFSKFSKSVLQLTSYSYMAPIRLTLRVFGPNTCNITLTWPVPLGLPNTADFLDRRNLQYSISAQMPVTM